MGQKFFLNITIGTQNKSCYKYKTEEIPTGKRDYNFDWKLWSWELWHRKRQKFIYFVLTIFAPTSDQPQFVSSPLFALFSSPSLPSASYSADTRWENDDNKIWHDENVSTLLLLKLLTNCWHNNEEKCTVACSCIWINCFDKFCFVLTWIILRMRAYSARTPNTWRMQDTTQVSTAVRPRVDKWGKCWFECFVLCFHMI